MDKLKELKMKHNHKLTDILKVLIFSIIMLAPFIAVGYELCFGIRNDLSTTAYQDATNVFYTAVAKLNTQPLFNWTQNTAIYSAINQMTTGLEFGTGGNTLALLLTYWSLNIAIYIIFDIVIVLFTKLTHLINND